MGHFSTRKEVDTWDSGKITKCTEKEPYTSLITRLPTREIGYKTIFGVGAYSTTRTHNSLQAAITTNHLTKSTNTGSSTRVSSCRTTSAATANCY